MKKIYQISIAVTILMCCFFKTNAQFIGGEIYLPGHYLEIGQNAMGAFGGSSSPAGYHANPYAGYLPLGSGVGTDLAEVYDYGHDGWTVGAPAYTGDYTYPGFPFEGWGIEIGTGGPQNFAFTGYGAIMGSGSLTGANVSYVNAGGELLGNWQGTCDGGQLTVDMETRVDTNASWVVITTKLYNTGATAINDVYYLRSCDPDNDEADGGGFPTHNMVIEQNDAIHRVQVRATGEVLTYDFLALCTKDQRAKCFVYSAWPLSTTVDLSSVYAETAGGITPDYTVGTADDGDIAIGLIFYICSIPAHDSAVVSCAYTFLNTTNGIDSAFPEPSLVVDSVTSLPPAPGAAIVDTFFSCEHPGVTNVPVNLGGSTSGVWTWSSWTWSAGLGLSATTGTSVTIDISVLMGVTTYTIVGTDSLPGSECPPGNIRYMYLTIVPCFGATSNAPCIGNTLFLNAIGDSTGATYQWFSPGSTTTFSTLHHIIISPSTWADTGTWTVIRSMGGALDTATTHVTIHPLPTFSLACNGDSLCSNSISTTPDTMKLYCYPYVAGDHFSWTGPDVFTSTSENPYLTPYLPADTGLYKVVVTDTFGCEDSNIVDARIIPPIIAPTITGVHHYCTGEAFVPFGITLMVGASALWYTDSVGGTGSTFAPLVDISYAHTVTVYASQIEGICEGLRASFTVVVDSTPPPPVLSSNTPVCADSTLRLTANDGLGGGSYSWSGPFPASINTYLQNPVIPDAQIGNSGTYTVVYSFTTTCQSTANTSVVVNTTPAPPVLSADSPCNGFTLTLIASDSYSGCIYSWSGPDGFISTLISPSVNPAKLGINDGVYTAFVTLAGIGGSCSSSPTTINTMIWPNPAAPITHDTAYCQFNLNPIPLWADSLTDSAVNSFYNYLTWFTSPTGMDSVIEPFFPSTNVPGTFTWYVRQTTVHSASGWNNCISLRTPENIHVLDSPGFSIWVSNTFACQDSSLTLRYEGQAYFGLEYEWTKPNGATFVGGNVDSSFTAIQFDSIYHDTVSLFVSDNEWNISCYANRQVNIKVVQAPWANGFVNTTVCAGDTVNVELTQHSDNAFSFIWNLDLSSIDNIITSTSGTSGPYGVQWNLPGTKMVTIIPVTAEGCLGQQVYDTVLVRNLPYASFNHGQGGLVCADDSVLFQADMGDSAGYKYIWAPTHFFNQTNQGSCWGRVDISGYVTLTVIDGFGCVGQDSLLFETNPTCCEVFIPSGFSPNGNGLNDYFRPLFVGSSFHTFHVFRIQNRWGQTVFSTNNSNMSWDGNFNGVPQEIGVYYYYLEYDCNGQTIHKSGDVTLIR